MTTISADSSIGIYHNNSAFYGHKPPNNVWSFLPHQMPLSEGQNCQLNDEFAALHCWPFLLIHVFSLHPLTYKRKPGQALPSHTSSQAIFLSLSSPTVQRNSIHSACQFHPATQPPVHSLVPDDLAIKMLPIFFIRCSHMSSTTYPKIATSGIETQPGSDPSWLLPHVCTHYVHMNEILILFLLYLISSRCIDHTVACSLMPSLYL
jgi:hypothetical protein